MDTLKIIQSVIKDVFHDFHSTENRSVPSIRMSEILNISQTSQNSNQKLDNTRLHKTMMNKEKQKFFNELLFVTDQEGALNGINHNSNEKIFDIISGHHNTKNQSTYNEEEKNYIDDPSLSEDCGGAKHTNVKEMHSYIDNECLMSSKTGKISRIENHEFLEKYISQELQSKQMSLDSTEELSKEVRRTFEMLKNKHNMSQNNKSFEFEKGHTRSEKHHNIESIGRGVSDKCNLDWFKKNTTIANGQKHRQSVEARVDVHQEEKDINKKHITEEEGDEEEVVLRRDISDGMTGAMRSSGLNIVIPSFKGEYHEALKNIVGKETDHLSPTTKTPRTKKAPVMGKAALLQKSNIDHADYLIIQDLILAKYSNKIRQYLERNHKRRKSRCEHFEEYISSSQCTPSSISSLDYLNSLDGYDQKTGLMLSSPDRDILEENINNSVNSSPYIQKASRSYSMNKDFIGQNSHTSCSSMSELDSRESGCCGNSTKLISHEGEEMSNQESERLEVGKIEEWIQCVDCNNLAPEYQRHKNHGNDTKPDMVNASNIISDAQNNDKKLNFMKSTDDFNVHSPANSTMCSTYSVSKFIANALSGVSAAQEHEDNNHTIGSASYQSPNYTSYDESITTSKVSDLLSKGSTLTNGLSKGRRLIRTSSLYESEDDILELASLTTDLSVQNQILLQASKAVKHCRENDILHSTGYIEAERILLLASETKKALNEEIHSVEAKKYYSKTESTLSTGQIKIKNIVFDLGRSNSQNNKHLEVFLVLVKCGREVHGSRVLQSRTSKIDFDRIITFENLTSDFRICIGIYSMILTLQEDHHYNCPSPMNMFHVNRHSKRSSSMNEDANLNVTSAFTLSANCDIKISDLIKTDETGKLCLKLRNISKESVADKICLTIQSKLKLNSCLRGFLTVGTENEHCCIIWNRRWCMLKGPTLVYWNHPSEEEFTPNGSIDLRDCIENYIAIAERHICSRPRSLMVPIKKGEDFKRYFLAADDNIELDTWNKQLNLTVRALKVWKSSEVIC